MNNWTKLELEVYAGTDIKLVSNKSGYIIKIDDVTNSKVYFSYQLTVTGNMTHSAKDIPEIAEYLNVYDFYPQEIVSYNDDDLGEKD